MNEQPSATSDGLSDEELDMYLAIDADKRTNVYRLASEIRRLRAELAAAKEECDSETRWAKQYFDEAAAARADAERLRAAIQKIIDRTGGCDRRCGESGYWPHLPEGQDHWGNCSVAMRRSLEAALAAWTGEPPIQDESKQ